MTAGQSSSALQLLGRVGQASKKADEALSRARASRHLFTLGHALTMGGLWLSFLRREPEKLLAYSEEVIALSEENGFGEWPGFGAFFRGWALAELGELEKGVDGMETALETFKQRGGIPDMPIHPAELARGYARLGRTDLALTTLEEILTGIEPSGAVGYKAEILRIKGEVLLRGNTMQVDAESCFRAAIDVARTQEAKWWELRATTSLARFLRDTNRRDEAHAMLAKIYDWFTDGFDTADLKDAKALLDELSDREA